LRQLQLIQRQFRDSPIMHGAVKEIDADGMKAVAEYVQSL
jgi:cytochrome c553